MNQNATPTAEELANAEATLNRARAADRERMFADFFEAPAAAKEAADAARAKERASAEALLTLTEDELAARVAPVAHKDIGLSTWLARYRSKRSERLDMIYALLAAENAAADDRSRIEAVRKRKHISRTMNSPSDTMVVAIRREPLVVRHDGEEYQFPPVGFVPQELAAHLEPYLRELAKRFNEAHYKEENISIVPNVGTLSLREVVKAVDAFDRDAPKALKWIRCPRLIWKWRHDHRARVTAGTHWEDIEPSDSPLAKALNVEFDIVCARQNVRPNEPREWWSQQQPSDDEPKEAS